MNIMRIGTSIIQLYVPINFSILVLLSLYDVNFLQELLLRTRDRKWLPLVLYVWPQQH